MKNIIIFNIVHYYLFYSDNLINGHFFNPAQMKSVTGCEFSFQALGVFYILLVLNIHAYTNYEFVNNSKITIIFASLLVGINSSLVLKLTLKQEMEE